MSAASGIDMPVNVNGWRNVVALDFDKEIAPGKVIGDPTITPYMSAYPTGWRTSKPWRTGTYDNRTMYCSGSKLVVPIYTDAAGVPRVAALTPHLSKTTPYGAKSCRISYCFRIPTPLPGYKVAWLLWPDSGVWPRDGEIDFPECHIDGTHNAAGYMHRMNGVAGSDQEWCKTDVNVADGEWHVCTINYKSGTWRTPMCEFVIDGNRVASFKERVPAGPMHPVIQTEPLLGTWDKPDPTVTGTIEFDWIATYVAA